MNNHPTTMSGNCGPEEALSEALSEILATGHLGTVALAISGGIDSMVLLETARLLMTQEDSPPWDCVCLHVDHGLRADSALDAELVAEEAAKAGLECEILTADIDKDSPGSLEEKARIARYELLYSAMAARGIKVLLTAQHLNDQAETVMIQHMRGADLLGLAGMPKSRFLLAGEDKTVHRPFLSVKSETIHSFAKNNDVRWREDRSNKDLRHRRNLVRNLVFPMLENSEGQGKDWDERLTQLAQGVKQANQKIVKMALAVEAVTDFTRDYRKNAKSVAMILEGLQVLPAEVSFHLLERQLATVEAPAGSLTPKIFAQIITAEEPGEVFELKRNLHARTRLIDDELMLEFEMQIEAKETGVPAAVSIKSGDRLKVEGLGVLEVDMRDEAAPRHADNEQWMPMRELQGELTLRVPCEGERMAPFGMSGNKLVSDLLQEAGIPADERWERPLVADEAGILWIPFVRASERCRILGTKGPFLRLRFEELEA
ncbi:MAG: tRNA(Ile)-lysidine synthase [Planctomycetota bacterium]|jgi:tRNA(Ile)-lysidine synthase